MIDEIAGTMTSGGIVAAVVGIGAALLLGILLARGRRHAAGVLPPPLPAPAEVPGVPPAPLPPEAPPASGNAFKPFGPLPSGASLGTADRSSSDAAVTAG